MSPRILSWGFMLWVAELKLQSVFTEDCLLLDSNVWLVNQASRFAKNPKS